MISFIVFFILFLFRRWLLEPFIGKHGIEVVDAVVFIAAAAWLFALPIPNWEWVSYGLGIVCIFAASSSVTAYNRLISGEKSDVS